MTNILQSTPNDVELLYGGKLDKIGLSRLFPSRKFGCINFGYWNEIPKEIGLQFRLKSQIDLYRKIFSYANLSPDMCTLEVGCGRGHGVSLLNEIEIEAWGIDLVKEQINLCKKNYPAISKQFVLSSATDISFPSNRFDCLLSLEAAQHFPCFKTFCDEAYRVLKKESTMVISTFFYTGENTKNDVLEIIPSNISGTHHMIDIKSAVNHLLETGFKDIKIESIGDKTFEGFSLWAAQQKLENSTPHSSKWLDAYNQQLIDYNVIICRK